MSINFPNPKLAGLLSKVRALINSTLFGRAEATVVLLGLLLLFVHRIGTTVFFEDESTWIRYSSYFDVLMRGDFSATTWGVTRVLIDQPPLAPDLIGLGRLLGHQPELAARWSYLSDYAYNLAQGAVPTPELLWWSRLPMTLMAALAGSLIFVGVCWAAGRLAGYLWLFFYCFSPFITTSLSRAMAEPPLLAAVVVAGLAGGWAFGNLIRSFAGPQLDRTAYKRSLLGWGLMGIASGLAAAAKLNGAVIVLAGLACCGLVLVTRPWAISWLGRMRLVGIAGVVLLGLSAATFVLINPFLYREPVSRSWMFVTHRAEVIQGQEVTYASDYIGTWPERLRIVPDEIFNQHAFGQFPGSFWLNLGLSVIGLGVVVWTARGWRSNDPAATSSLMLLAATFTVAVPPLFTPLNWDRYYLLPIVAARIFTVVALAKIINNCWAILFSRLLTKQQAVLVS